MSEKEEPEANRLEAVALTVIFFLCSSTLLCLIGTATRTNARGGWWTQPWLMPSLALGVLVLTNAITLWREIADIRKHPPSQDEKQAARTAILGWLLPLEFLAYFGAYVWATQHTGYAVGTLLFVLFLSWRAGLRDKRWFLAGLGLVLFMVLVFRVGLGVWMPAPDYYDLFPKEIRTMWMRWF